MHTIFVSGNDTGIGKTQVVAALSREYCSSDYSVQIVKPLETGVTSYYGADAPHAASLAGIPIENAHTLLTYSDPIAPLEAAKNDGVTLTMDLVLSGYAEVIEKDIRIVEGAGGLAVPIGQHNVDWCDFINRIPTNIVLLVVEDRLGTLNQARTLAHYASSKNIDALVLLNEVNPQAEALKASNKQGIIDSQIPFAGCLGYNQEMISWNNESRKRFFPHV